ncbi:MAG: SH3 domain-containing protein, partial [Ruminococcus sp.]|nr:SH3 domain-containing protein [Ruminococcus sp.]
MKKTTSFLSAFALSVMTVISPAETAFAEENNITPVYEHFNSNDVNGRITVDIPKDTTAEIRITFTSPEVTDEPYYIKDNIESNSTLSFNIEGRDTTEDDYRNYTLSVAVTGSEYNDTITYTENFNVPDGNDNPDSFLDYRYTFEADDKYTGKQWEVLSETETQKKIVLHLNGYQLGDVNSDGFIDAVDASMILTEYSLLSTNEQGTFSSRQKLAADVNNDDMIDAVDASMVLIYYSELSTGGNPSWDSINDDTTTLTTTTAKTTTTATTTTTAIPSAVDYSEYVSAVKTFEDVRREISSEYLFHNYSVYDMDNDGIYELIIERGPNEDDDKYEFYSIADNTMIFVGEIPAGNSTLTQNDGKLYKDYRNDKKQTVQMISFDGKKISAENIYENTSGEFKDYGKSVALYEWSDMTGLDIINNKSTTTGTSNTTTKTTTTTTTTAKTTTTTTTTTTATTATSIPQEKLDSAMKKAVTAQSYLLDPRYSYFDVNNDNIPELFIKGENLKGTYTNLFVYKNGEFIETEKWGEKAYICAEKNLLRLYVKDGATVNLIYSIKEDGNPELIDSLSIYNLEYYHNDSKISEVEYKTLMSDYDVLLWTEPKYTQVQLYGDYPNIQNAPADMVYYSQPQKGNVNVESEGLNMRTGAGTDYSIITLIPKNAEINILGKNSGWYYIIYNNSYGYVSADYIKINSTTTTTGTTTSTTKTTTTTTTTTTTAKTTTTTATTATAVPQETLNSAMKKAVTAQSYLLDPKYSYVDINNDNIPELFIKGENLKGTYTNLFVYKNGEFIKTEKWGENAYICTEKKLLRLYANEGATVNLIYSIKEDGNPELIDSLSIYNLEYYH